MLDFKLHGTPNQERVEDVCRRIYLAVIDKYWMEHIDEMQYLREKVSLYGYAQLDPLVIYKQEAFNKYQALLMTIKKETLGRIFRTDLIGTEQQLIQEAAQFVGEPAGQEMVLDLLRDVAEHIGQNPQAFGSSQQQQRGGRVIAEGITASGEKKTIETTYGSAKVLSEGNDFEILEVDDTSVENSRADSPSEAVSARKDHGKLRPNDKVSVKHVDGRLEYDVKWKKVKEDVEAGRAQVI